MDRQTASTVVDVVLGLLFAAAMGASIVAVLISDFMQPGKVMSEPARQTLVVCALAGLCAGLAAWWLQRFVANRGIVVRFFFAFVIFLLLFGALGGLFEVIRKFATSPGGADFSLSGLYWSSLGGFYTFLLFLIIPLRPALFGLWLAAGLIIAIVGPQRA